MIKLIMSIIARRKLAVLYREKNRIEAAINRARKSKSRVSDLYTRAKRTNESCLYWEAWR